MSRTTQICFRLWGPYGQSIGEMGPSIRCYTHEWHTWWLFLMGLGPYWAIYKSPTAQFLVLLAQLFLLFAKTSPAVLFLIKQPLWHLISFASRALSDPFFDYHLIQPSPSVLSYCSMNASAVTIIWFKINCSSKGQVLCVLDGEKH